MLRVTFFALLAIAGPCVVGLSPRGSRTEETIAVDHPPVSRQGGFTVDASKQPLAPSLDTVDLSQVALFAHPLNSIPACPVVDPFQALQTSPRRRREVGPALQERAFTQTPLGIKISTVPSNAAEMRDTAAHKYELKLNGQGTLAPGDSFLVSLLHYPLHPLHPLPGWRDTSGRTRSMLYSVSEDLQDFNSKDAVDLSGRVLAQANTLNQQLLHTMSQIEAPVNGGPQSLSLTGKWSMLIIPFGSVPGYCYSIRRLDSPIVPARFTIDDKSNGFVGLLLVHQVLTLLNHELAYCSLPISMTESYWIRVLLYVLEDLFQTSSATIWSGGGGPRPGPGAQDVRDVIEVFATGTMSGRDNPTEMFRSEGQMMDLLQTDPVCRAATGV